MTADNYFWNVIFVLLLLLLPLLLMSMLLLLFVLISLSLSFLLLLLLLFMFVNEEVFDADTTCGLSTTLVQSWNRVRKKWGRFICPKKLVLIIF